MNNSIKSIKINNSNIKKYIDEINDEFYKRNGYVLFRCYDCVLPKLFFVLEDKNEMKKDNKIQELIAMINSTYRLGEEKKQNDSAQMNFKCGYDCIFYEDRREAYPFPFWEIDKSKYTEFMDALKKIYSMYAQKNH